MKEGQRRTRRCSAKDQEAGYGTGPWMRLGDRSQRWTDMPGLIALRVEGMQALMVLMRPLGNMGAPPG